MKLNVDKIHTTMMGINRIKNNLKIYNGDVVDYCKRIVSNNECLISKKGKNYYCILDNIVITINASSYTIITAHILKENK